MQNNLEFNSRKSYKKSTQIIAGKGKIYLLE